MDGDYEVTFTLGQMKVEHVGEALRRLQAVDRSFIEEGLAVSPTYSVERNHDGVERWHDWIDGEGNIRDIAHWEER